MNNITIAHIINPVVVGESSDLHTAQPVTFESMRLAKHFAEGKVQVELYAAQYPEDKAILPDYFKATPDLERSVLDVGSFQNKRKLPLIKDILDRLYAETDADYLIYTNVDIALMPHFYLSVVSLIEKGYENFVVNRRTIPGNFKNMEELPLMYSELGESHPGYDCFVFRRDTYPKFHLGEVCIGVNWIGTVLLWNLVCGAKKFRELKDAHLTFHIGNDRNWKQDDFADYAAHNKTQAIKVLAELEDAFGPFDHANRIAPYLKGLQTKTGKKMQNSPESSILTKVASSMAKLKRNLRGQ